MLREIHLDTIVVAGGSPIALAGALAGYACQVPVAHLDAGIRTFAEHPSTDEKNHELIARLARWHFTATEQARCNLLEEKIPPSRIFEVGSTLVDAALWSREHLRAATHSTAYAMPDALREFLFQCRSRRLIVAISDETTHNDHMLSALGNALAATVENHPEARVAWLTDDRRKAVIDHALRDMPTADRAGIFLHPLPDFPLQIDILTRCSFVIAESREIQQIASAFSKPVLIPNRHFAIHDLVKAGGAVCVAANDKALSEQCAQLLQDPFALKNLQLQVSPFGDGNAAERIGEIISIIQ
jgi:UDP-N-acetylglucosamine 2-epimerase